MVVFLILVLISYVSCQEMQRNPISPGCYPNADFQTRRCCIFPPFFARDIAQECGAKTRLLFVDDNNNVTISVREMKSGCIPYRCILASYDLIDANLNLELEKFYNHLDVWIDLNPSFKEVTNAAKANCRYNNGFIFPITTCTFYDFLQCIRNYINVNCPERRSTPECQELAEFYNRCKEFYI